MAKLLTTDSIKHTAPIGHGMTLTVTITYPQLRSALVMAERERDEASHEWKQWRATQDQPNQCGLTPAHVKFHPEYQRLKKQWELASAKCRSIDKDLNRQFKTQYQKDIRAEIQARRDAKLSARMEANND